MPGVISLSIANGTDFRNIYDLRNTIYKGTTGNQSYV